MGAVDQHAPTRHNVKLGMVITRADGTVVDVGTVSAHYANPLKRAWWRIAGRRRAAARIRHANRQGAR